MKYEFIGGVIALLGWMVILPIIGVAAKIVAWFFLLGWNLL